MLTSAAGEFEVFANAPWFGDKLQGQNMEIRWSILVANNSTVISPKKNGKSIIIGPLEQHG